MFLRIQLMTLSCWLFTQKRSILDTWRGSEYACVQIALGNVLCHHNKHLMRYFEFLIGSRIICLPLNISEKLHWQHCLWKARRGRDSSPSSLLIPYTQTNNIYYSNKRGPPPFFHSDTSPVLGHVLVHSVDKTNVQVVTVELI